MTRRKLDLAALSYDTDPVPKIVTVTVRPVDQRVLVPKQFVQTSKEVPFPTPHSITHTEELRGSKRKRSKGKDVVEGSDEQTLAEEWLSPLEYKSWPITVVDSVTDSCDLTFYLSKTLLLPLDMVECNVDSESLIKGSIQMVTALALRLHVLEQRRLEQVTDFNRTTQLFSDADLALKSAEAERIKAEEEAATARVSALAKEKALLETEKIAMVALAANKEVEQRKLK